MAVEVCWIDLLNFFLAVCFFCVMFRKDFGVFQPASIMTIWLLRRSLLLCCCCCRIRTIEFLCIQCVFFSNDRVSYLKSSHKPTNLIRTWAQESHYSIGIKCSFWFNPMSSFFPFTARFVCFVFLFIGRVRIHTRQKRIIHYHQPNDRSTGAWNEINSKRKTNGTHLDTTEKRFDILFQMKNHIEMKSTGEQLLNHVHVGFSLLFFMCYCYCCSVCGSWWWSFGRGREWNVFGEQLKLVKKAIFIIGFAFHFICCLFFRPPLLGLFFHVHSSLLNFYGCFSHLLRSLFWWREKGSTTHVCADEGEWRNKTGKPSSD